MAANVQVSDAAHASGRLRRSGSAWSPARWYLLIFTLFHVPVGVAGLVIDRSFPLGAEAARQAGSEHLFGVFETNGWHSLGALGLGLIAAWVTLNPQRARGVALAIGVLHVGLFVSLVLFEASVFWIASNWADQVVHASSAVGGIIAAVATRSRGSAGVRGE